MGLFDKKYCDICGAKIGLFGNKKVEDGNMCRDCARKLSPWFDDRRHTTLENIKEQLEYREQNRAAVADFHPTFEGGEDNIVYVDLQSRTFAVVDCSPNEFEERNPDIFELKDVQSVDWEVSDTRTEITRTDRDGNEVSYSPPRYLYRYRFYITIRLDHPYVDTIRFQMNEYPLEIEHRDTSFFGISDPNPTRDSEYRRLRDNAEEIKDVLTGTGKYRDKSDIATDSQGNEVPVVTCPYCGSRTRRTYTGRCEHCGGYLD